MEVIIFVLTRKKAKCVAYNKVNDKHAVTFPAPKNNRCYNTHNRRLAYEIEFKF
jgi:hypothetical protein